jgi:hypothetical protein
MTDTTDTTTDASTSTPADSGVNISVEQILAAIIKVTGDVNVPLETLVANYSSKTISVNQLEDKSVTFSLVDLPAEAEAQPAEAAE